MNNPLKYIDPDGRDITLRGAHSQLALKEIQSGVGKGITIDHDNNTGYLSYTVNNEKNLSQEAKRIITAIDDRVIQINLKTVDDLITPDGKEILGGGAFGGNEVYKDGEDNVIKVVAEQIINPRYLNSLDNAHGQPGKTTMHEITEAYEGAKNSQKSGVAASPSTYKEAKENPNNA